MKTKKIRYVGNGQQRTARLMVVRGVAILEMWGGENTYTIQLMTMQNGQTDVSFVSAVVDNPIEHHMVTFCDRGEQDWEKKLHMVVVGLVRGLCYRGTSRVIAEPSERRLTEALYSALLRSVRGE
jgi:hypothetical protein